MAGISLQVLGLLHLNEVFIDHISFDEAKPDKKSIVFRIMFSLQHIRSNLYEHMDKNGSIWKGEIERVSDEGLLVYIPRKGA